MIFRKFCPNSHHVFLLFSAGNLGGAFAINSSGSITVAQKLDRETKSTYELTITAQDRAGTIINVTFLCI